MKQRKLASPGVTVPILGLGRTGMSEFYGVQNGEESVAPIHRAIGRL
jgi:hypothetical protein